MLTPRFLAMPTIALTVIVMLAQAHSQPDVRRAEIVSPPVYHAVNCTTPLANVDSACPFAGKFSTSVVR
jgi:hypothetical protein